MNTKLKNIGAFARSTLKNILIIILLIVILVFFILPIINALFKINTYRIDQYVDLNSGDLKYERYIFDCQIKPVILETAFSKEVRRLDINVPDSRIWKYISGKDYGLSLFQTTIGDNIFYGHIAVALLNIKRYFDLYNIPDNERIPIIEEVLLCIKKENANEAEKALKDYEKKLMDSKIRENMKYKHGN